MRKLLMNIWKWSFLVLITIMWILLYLDNKLVEFDKAQWGIMIMFNFVSIFAFFLLQWVFKICKKEDKPNSELFTRYWENIDS